MRYYKSQAEQAQAEALQKNVGGLNKSHRVQRVSSSIEMVYFSNSAILATEAREQRATDQRESRRAKR
jgi:hypothetical protein